jgi:hypothetical protein
MANQKFSAILREAIWIAHSKRCAYTHELVDLASMHVDHIIPEHLATKPDEFAAVRATLGLPADFELFGLENLLPAKPGANLQKGDLTLNAAGAHFFLNIAASKKSGDRKQHQQDKSPASVWPRLHHDSANVRKRKDNAHQSSDPIPRHPSVRPPARATPRCYW